MDERIAALGARPDGGVHPEGAVRGNAIELHAAGAEGVADLLHLLETALTVIEHVVARLRARGASGLGVIEKSGEGLAAMLGAFDGCVVSVGGHGSGSK